MYINILGSREPQEQVYININSKSRNTHLFTHMRRSMTFMADAQEIVNLLISGGRNNQSPVSHRTRTAIAIASVLEINTNFVQDLSSMKYEVYNYDSRISPS